MALIQFIKGPPGSGKTRQLVATAVDLYQQGVKSSQVLILCASHVRQEQFRQALLAQSDDPLEELALYTYPGFVRNVLLNVWPLAETRIQHAFPAQSEHVGIVPDVVGVEESETLLRHLLGQTLATAPDALLELGQSNRATINQLIRRQRIRSEHRIDKSTFAGHDKVLEIPCREVLHRLEAAYDQTSLRLRWLDGSRQLDVFHGLLTQEPWLLDWLCQTYRYLLVDDGDESTPAQQAFIDAMAPQLEALWLASDPQGGSRQGYLNAAPHRWQTLCAELTLTHETDSLTLPPQKQDPLSETIAGLAQTVSANWLRFAAREPLKPVFAELVRRVPLPQCWLAMVDQSLDALDDYIKEGGPVSDLLWVVPDASLITLAPWRHGLERRRIPHQILSGTTRASANPLVRAWGLMFQLVNARQWGMPLSSLEFSPVLGCLLGWQRRAPRAIEAVAYWLGPLHQQAVWGHAESVLPSLDHLVPNEAVPHPCREDLRVWADWVRQWEHRPAYEQWWAIYERWVQPAIPVDDDGHALQQMSRSFERQAILSGRLALPPKTAFAPWLLQVKAGVAADSPAVPDQADLTALIIGTPQKVVDYEIRRPLQWWLDASSPQWHRTDEAPLYNVWLHSQPVATGQLTKPTAEQTDLHRAQRAAAVTRALILNIPSPLEPAPGLNGGRGTLRSKGVRDCSPLPERESLSSRRRGVLSAETGEGIITLFSSPIDAKGDMQAGWLPAIMTPTGQEGRTLGGLTIPTLRDDQSPILQYTAGTLAISAVPGAGKTFVNVALILDRIAQGTPPEEILVLTYMESAARTLLARLKTPLEAAGYQMLPQVSTIHALAFKLLTDAPPPLGLSAEVTIIDDLTSEALLRQVANETQPPAAAGLSDLKDWSRTLASLIPHAKSLQLGPADMMGQPNQTMQALGQALAAYQRALATLDGVDFTDLIVKAVDALAGDAEYRKAVQGRYGLIIEDEAQDSSRLMQRFLGLLGGERPNLIRTGDTNQSITTTFSTADTTVFRQFVEEAEHRVKMTRSGRCAPEIIALANRWIAEAPSQNPHLAAAFVPVEMQVVEDVNPTLLEPIRCEAFDTEAAERTALVATLTRWRADYPDAPIAVLVRGNRQALEIAAVLQQASVPTVCFSEERQTSPVLGVLLAWLRVLAAPHLGAHRVALINALATAGCYGLGTGITGDEALWAERLAWLREVMAASPVFHVRATELPEDEALLQLVADWRDWQRQADTPALPEVLVRMGERLFSRVVDRSNAYLAALQAQQFLRQSQELSGMTGAGSALPGQEPLSPLQAVMGHFEQAVRSRRGLKRFTEEALGMAPQAGVVQVMSLHKAKGQEFDLVWIPGLVARQHPAWPKERKLKEDEQLTVLLNQLAATGKIAHEGEAIAAARAGFLTAILEEEARLFYVGLTRARRGLVLSTFAEGRNHFGRMEKQTPAFGWAFCAGLQSVNSNNDERIPCEGRGLYHQPSKQL